MQNGDYLQRDGFWTVGDHVAGEFGGGPEPYRQCGDILPLNSHAGIFRQTAAGGENLSLDIIGGILVVFRDEPPEGIKVLGSLRRELKWRVGLRQEPRLRSRRVESLGSPAPQLFYCGVAVDQFATLGLREAGRDVGDHFFALS